MTCWRSSNATWRIPSIVGLLMIWLAAGVGSAQADDGYDVAWSVIGDGGQSSRAGDYEVIATIEQPDAGTMSGGTYTLSSEFWAAVGPSAEPAACVGGRASVLHGRPAAVPQDLECSSPLLPKSREHARLARIATHSLPWHGGC